MCNITATFTQVITANDARCQYRESESSSWKPAKSGDVLREGAEIRTSLNGGATLRLEKTCGCDTKKGTVTVRAGTVYRIPSEVPDKDVVTSIGVASGKADFKVDKVGLTNDFKAVTPSTTLGVRG
jgi:hypothetical protein